MALGEQQTKNRNDDVSHVYCNKLLKTIIPRRGLTQQYLKFFEKGHCLKKATEEKES